MNKYKVGQKLVWNVPDDKWALTGFTTGRVIPDKNIFRSSRETLKNGYILEILEVTDTAICNYVIYCEKLGGSFEANLWWLEAHCQPIPPNYNKYWAELNE